MSNSDQKQELGDLVIPRFVGAGIVVVTMALMGLGCHKGIPSGQSADAGKAGSQPSSMSRAIEVTVDGALVRKGKQVVARVAKGTRLKVIEKAGRWYGVAVEVDGGEVKGWLHEEMVRPIPKSGGESAASREATAAGASGAKSPAGPWSITAVRKSTIGPGGGGRAEIWALYGGGEKFLYVAVAFKNMPKEADLKKFRIVKRDGQTVGSLHGWRCEADSLLIYDGRWASLEGLYLSGLGHREPLVGDGTREGSIEIKLNFDGQ